MGCMGLRLKGNNFCFLTDLQFIQCLAIFFGLLNLSVCLFEDQIGKFDWKQSYVGQIKFAHFNTVSTAKKIIIATEENVVAALNFKSGHILWRQVLERAQNGQIQYLHVDNEIVSVSGQSPWLVRTWEPTTGRLLWEWSLALTKPIQARGIFWLMSQNQLIQLVTEPSSLEVTGYNVHTGQNKGGTTRISAPWITNVSRCVVTGTIFACISGSDSSSSFINYIDLIQDDNRVKTYPIQMLIGAQSGEVTIKSLKGPVPGIIFQINNVNRIVLFDSANVPRVLTNNISIKSSMLTMEYMNEKALLYTSEVDESITISAINLDNEKEIPELSSRLNESYTNSELFAGLWTVRRDGSVACRYLLATCDHAVHFVQNSVADVPVPLLWTREEALAHIVAVDLLDLPVSDLDASIEREFDSKEGNFVEMVGRRLSSQAKQLRLLLLALLGKRAPEHQTGLLRDEFGLHKIIVAVTRAGKLYGIDNLTGKIIWKKYLENIKPFSVNEKESMLLYVQRTTRHLPWAAQCLLLAQDKDSHNGVSYTFDPMTGEALGEGLVRTNYQIKQTMAFPRLTDEFLRPVLVLDSSLTVHVLPSTATNILTSDLAHQMFLYTADAESGELRGYALIAEPKIGVVETWTLRLGTGGQRITNIAAKSALERVHAQGRVLPDRSVLYKYVNPNLVAVVTHGPDTVHRHVANVYLVDVVSGVVVSAVSHKRARDPLYVVHSENWLVYTYFNDKWRRTEVGTLELYEGQTQSNATAFSSLAPPPPPLLERQAYILAAQPVAAAVTLTEKGITSKHVLLALNSGGVLELPWLLLDPRRPSTPTVAVSELREEGVIPYIPELPLPHEAIINYNQTLHRVRGIHTAPSGLESTCLVLVHGLDIFYTRVTPSKTFDLLKDDFDYYLIVIVLSALLLASYVTKHLASRKAMRQAWK